MNFKLFLSVIFILFSHPIWSYPGDRMINDIIDDIFQKAEGSIKRVEEGRIFFYPEKISTSNGKIFLETATGQEIPLPHLFTSDSGPYIDLKSMQKIWICTTPWCQTVYYEEPRECLKCHTSSFIIRYQ